MIALRRTNRLRTNRLRLVLPAVVAGAVVMSGCSSSEGSGDEGPGEAVVREAAAPAALSKVVSLGMMGYSKLSACLENQEVGQPCQATDADNIRQTLNEVKQLRAEIAANQQQALAEFDSVRNLIRDQNIRQVSANLRDMVINTELAGQAYEALAECAQSTTGTCRPFIGRDADPEEDVATAIPKTRDYFLEKASNLPDDLPVTASWFTGTRPAFDDGLADAIWRFNKGIQDQQAGVTNDAVKNSATVPVVTGALATAQNQDIGYWADVFADYAFLSVLYAGFSGGDSVAERRQAEADARIGNTTQRQSVLGTTAHYELPETLGEPGVIVAEGGRAWLVAGTTVSNGRPLEPGDIVDLSRIINTYSPVESFAAIGGALPPDRWYAVQTPVEKVNYSSMTLPPLSLADEPWTVGNVAGTWLVEKGGAPEFCTSRVRPTNSAPGFNRWAFPQTGGLFDQSPPFNPPDRLYETWQAFAENKPVEFAWSVTDVGPWELGWGAWVTCDGGTTGTLVELLRVPGVMGPAS